MSVCYYFPSLLEFIEKGSCGLFFKIIINFHQENPSIELNILDFYLEQVIFHYHISPVSLSCLKRRMTKVWYFWNVCCNTRETECSTGIPVLWSTLWNLKSIQTKYDKIWYFFSNKIIVEKLFFVINAF